MRCSRSLQLRDASRDASAGHLRPGHGAARSGVRHRRYGPPRRTADAMMREATRTGVRPSPPPRASSVCGLRGRFRKSTQQRATIAMLADDFAAQIESAGSSNRRGYCRGAGGTSNCPFAPEGRGPVPPGVELPAIKCRCASLFRRISGAAAFSSWRQREAPVEGACTLTAPHGQRWIQAPPYLLSLPFPILLLSTVLPSVYRAAWPDRR